MTDLLNNKLDLGAGMDNSDMPDLDALFSSARDNQPDLRDDNFSKVVFNSLPMTPVRRRRRGVSSDIIGVLLGLIAVYVLFDLNRFVSGILELMPQSVVLSPLHAVIALGTISIMSVLAWWTVENYND